MKDRLEKGFTWLIEQWRAEREDAKRTGDYRQYEWFLENFVQDFRPVYLQSTSPAWINLLGTMLKDASCELRRIRVKSKKSLGETNG